MSSRRATTLLLWLVTLANCLAVVAVCALWIDRPVADRVNHFMQHQHPLFDWTSRFLGLLPWALLPAGLILLGSWLWRRRGGTTPAWLRTPWLASWAVVGSLSAALVLKTLVGRSQVYPPWIERREYGFLPFHGGEQYGSFPSATMAVTAAILTVSWQQVPRLRLAAIMLGAAVGAGILLTNGHWLGDILGGAFLGVFNGWATVRMPGGGQSEAS